MRAVGRKGGHYPFVETLGGGERRNFIDVNGTFLSIKGLLLFFLRISLHACPKTHMFSSRLDLIG